MTKKIQLADFISAKTFLEVEKAFIKNHKLPLEICDCQGNQIHSMCSGNCHPEFCQVVRNTRLGLKKCTQEKIRSINIAIETGQPYISICHAGLVLVCIPIMENNIPLGGLFIGKCLWEEPTEIVIGDIKSRLKGVVGKIDAISQSFEKLAIYSPRKIYEISDYLFVLFYELTGLDPQIIKWRNEMYNQQSQIGEFIQEHKESITLPNYPYNYERQLMEKVKIGDKTGSRDILNIMLATIILSNPGDLSVLKARLFELLSILSRTAVEGGADVNILLKKNLDYIQQLMLINDQADICARTGKALDEFIELVYSVQDSQKITQLKPCIDYITRNYDKQIALSDVAKVAHLSVSRLAHIFKEQVGITIIDYLTKVRIEKAKQMLLFTDKNCTEVCFDVGYNNQSYFTRTFKDLTSMTPRQFKKSNQRNKTDQSEIK